jgi:hypothetical protein
MKLCECGCGQPTAIATKNNVAKGHVKGEPLRFLSQHHRRKSPVEYVEQPNGCWVWQRSLDSSGYGKKRHDGHLTSAHIYYFEQANGAVPKGLVLDHLCRNRSCVNPDHLDRLRTLRTADAAPRPSCPGARNLHPRSPESAPDAR